MAEDLELRLARKRQFSEFLEWEDRDGWSLKSQVEQSMLQRKGEAIVGLKTARQVSGGVRVVVRRCLHSQRPREADAESMQRSEGS